MPPSQWKPHRHGVGATLDLGVLAVSVEWGMTAPPGGKPNGYVWHSTAGAKSRRDLRFADFEEAKASAIRWARAALADAVAMLPDVEPVTPPAPADRRG